MRRRVIAALTGAAFAFAVLPGTAFAAECQIRSKPMGRDVTGNIIGFLTEEQAKAAIVQTQRNARGTIDPAYAANARARIRIDGRRGGVAIALVPEDMQVKLGQHVTFETGHRNPALPCNYVPNLIKHPAISRIFFVGDKAPA